MRGRLLEVDGQQSRFLVENLDTCLGTYPTAIVRRDDVIAVRIRPPPGALQR